MRIKDSSVFKRTIRPMEFVRNYFIAFEGFSEYQYFEGIKRYHRCLGIGTTVDIQLLTRFDHDTSDSDPRNIIKKMDEYRKLISEGRYSLGLFLGEILQQAFDQYKTNPSFYEYKHLKMKITKLKKELQNKSELTELALDGYLDENQLKDATYICES